MKIGIIHHANDSRDAIREIIVGRTDHRVIWTTNYGSHAAELSEKERPDLILLDIKVTDLDGVQVTKDLMNRSNCLILLLTTDPQKNSFLIFEAMAHGALDVAVIPKTGPQDQYSSLIRKISQLSVLVEPDKIKRTYSYETEGKPSSAARVPLIAIGASTGGPLAIASIISSFPANLEAAVVIVQHVDNKFSKGLVDWLSTRSNLPVRMVEGETVPKVGTIYVSDSKWHLMMTPDGRLAYTSKPESIPYRPSVDVFFESLASNWPSPSIAVLLTGMGSDGAKGLKKLKNRGWFTIAEDEESCAVFGMPKAAVEIGAVCEVLKLTKIPLKILSQMRKRKSIA